MSRSLDSYAAEAEAERKLADDLADVLVEIWRYAYSDDAANPAKVVLDRYWKAREYEWNENPLMVDEGGPLWKAER